MPKGLFDLTEDDAQPATAASDLPVDGKALAREVVLSQEYKESIRRRIRADNLPPAVELFFLHTLCGKPTERRELTFPEGIPDLSGLSDEELARRAERIAQRIRAGHDIAETLDKKNIM